MNKREQLETIFDFEDSLHVGDTVHIRWTNSNFMFESDGVVSKINRETLKVALNEQCGFPGHTYPTGHVIRVPRITNHLWSVNNRAEPVGGYQ